MNWSLRQLIAHRIHRMGYWFDPPEEHILIVRDAEGEEFCSVAFTGGFVAGHPPEPFTLHCLHGDDEVRL